MKTSGAERGQVTHSGPQSWWVVGSGAYHGQTALDCCPYLAELFIQQGFTRTSTVGGGGVYIKDTFPILKEFSSHSAQAYQERHAQNAAGSLESPGVHTLGGWIVSLITRHFSHSFAFGPTCSLRVLQTNFRHLRTPFTDVLLLP